MLKLVGLLALALVLVACTSPPTPTPQLIEVRTPTPSPPPKHLSYEAYAAALECTTEQLYVFGAPETAAILETVLTRLENVTPPPDLENYHQAQVDFVRAGLAFVEEQEVQGAMADSTGFRTAARTFMIAEGRISDEARQALIDADCIDPDPGPN